MKLFAIYNNSIITALCETREQVFTYLRSKYAEGEASFSSQSSWQQNYYVCAANLAAQTARWLKVFEIETEGGLLVPQYYQSRTNTMPDDFVDVTDSFFTVTEERYEGVSKMFAEVKSPRAKSFGMTVVVDPQFYGSRVRPVEEYEAMIGTFAKIRASTNIEGYGYANLTFAPESLTNFRIETQMINGFVVNWVE